MQASPSGILGRAASGFHVTANVHHFPTPDNPTFDGVLEGFSRFY
jgi:hypothetical protein